MMNACSVSLSAGQSWVIENLARTIRKIHAQSIRKQRATFDIETTNIRNRILLRIYGEWFKSIEYQSFGIFRFVFIYGENKYRHIYIRMHVGSKFNL